LAQSARAAAATARDSFLDQVRHAAAARYDIVRELGHGGFATVFLAHEKALSRDVALKVLHLNLMHDEELVQRFATEARTLASLRHRHVLRIHAIEDFAVAHCFVMEYVAGQTLESVARQHARLPIAAVQAIAYQVGEALDYAHRRGIIHRDIKPANVMLDEFGEVVVMDFGIARIVAGSGARQTVLMGTPQYMSPEQFRGGDIGAASDQYSLGVMLYRLLCGRAPFQSTDLISQMNAVWTLDPEPVTTFRPDCPSEVSTAVARMLAKDPAARFESCGAAAKAMGGTVIPAGHQVSHYLAALASMREPESVPVGPLSGPSMGPLGSLTDPSLTKILIEPIGRPLQLGERMDLVARAVDDTGTPVPGFEPAWSVEGDAVSLSGYGHIVAVKAGQAIVKVTSPHSPPEHMVVTVLPPPVDSVLVQAPRSRFVVGEVATLTAAVLDAGGRELESRTVVWSSDAPDVASVEREGAIRARSPGVVTITAECEGKRGAIELAIAGAPIASVRVSAERHSLKPGTTTTLAVDVIDQTGLAVRGEQVLFSSTEPTIATVDAHGVVTAVAEGDAEITAWCRDASGSVSITVLPDVVSSLQLQAPKSKVASRDAFTLLATPLGHGGVPLANRRVTWTTDQPSVVTVTPEGVVTGHAPGRATVSAACEGQRASVVLEVFEPLPTAPSRRPRALALTTLGLAGAVAVVVAVTSYGGDSGSEAEPSVPPPPTGPTVASLSFEPDAQAVRIGGSIPLRAVMFDDSGAVVDAPVRWTVSDTSIATLIGDSVAEFRRIGSVTITASASGRSASALLTVVDSAGRAPPTAARVVLRADVTRLYPSDSVPVRASALDADGLLLDGATVSLASSDAGVVAIRGRGMLVALRPGTAVIRGTADSVFGEMEVSVVPVPVREVRLSAATDTLRVDEAITLGLTVVDARGGQPARSASWTVDDARRARISEDGRLTALSPGPVRITAEVDGIPGFYSLLVVGGAEEPTTETAAVTRESSPFADVSAVFAGGARSCARTPRNVLCWGLDRADADPVSADLVSVSVGTAHACGLTRAGAAVCWGENRDGQLGTGSGPARASAGQPVAIPNGESLEQVTAGGDHTCALTTSGKAYCWGKNSFGQNGDGGTRNHDLPVEVRASTPFASISAGGSHTCAIGTDGAVYCWGDNFSGAVGTNRFEAESLPVNVDEGRFGFAKVYAGGKSTCALTAQGEAYCWGENRYGQVGVGNRTDRVDLRRPVQRDIRFNELALGERHACGLARGGELYCWGDNAFGQLGNGASADQRGLMVPTEVQTTLRFSSVAVGQSHSCAVAQEGGVYCWGDNSRRQLGSLADARVMLPTRLGGSIP